MNLDEQMTSKVAGLLAGGGPDLGTAGARALVADLRQQAARAPKIVGDLTGLSVDAVVEVPVSVVDRSGWARMASRSIAQMAGSDGTTRALGASMGMGAAMGFLGRNILGQYIPFENHLLLVAPNIAGFQRAYHLDGKDLALWVATHELTHAAQFAAAPWLADYLLDRAHSLISIAETDTADFSLEKGPGGDVTALMSLVEGHAEYVMNEVSPRLMPSKRRLIEAMAKRRASGGYVRKQTTKQLGMDEKAKQYASGNGFVSAVVAERGHEGLNTVWQSRENLPTLAEIRDPASWIARVLG